MIARILLTEKTSPLGAALSVALSGQRWRLTIPDAGEIDWSDRESVCAYIARQAPDVVVNTVGWSEVGDAAGRKLLADAAANIALASHRVGAIPVQLSSYSVFGGENRSAYDERDQIAPLTEQGRAFAAAERHVLSLSRSIVIRFGWLLSASQVTHYGRVLEQLKAGEQYCARASLRGVPVLAGEVARVVAAILKQVDSGAENWGVFHYAADDVVSEVELVELLCSELEKLGKVTGGWRVLEMDAEVINSSAVLKMKRCREGFGIHGQPWRPGLPDCLRAEE